MPYQIGDLGSYGCEGYPVIVEGTSRVVGCHKTKEQAERHMRALYANVPEASKGSKSEGFVPPATVRSNARRGLELRKKHNRGGTEIGVARARNLANGDSISYDTIKRMNSYFARHEVDKKGEGWGKDSAGYIAWLLWGGDAGWSWARGIIRQQESKEKSTMTDLTTAFFGIEKADRNADGTLMVYGKATDDSIDIDQQICDSDWLDRAMPAWFKSGGNIREQHSNIAAGVAKEYEAKGSEHYIRALVVDPVSVKKVETGVLKGFSVGIKNPRVVRDNKAANGRIIDGQIVEVSLVDRPANPNCMLVLAKSAAGQDTLIQAEDLIEKKEEEQDYSQVITPRKGEPADKDLYERVKREAKEKFDVYPSAVANAWVVREYKKRGGKYKTESKEKALQFDDTDLLKEANMATAQEIINLAVTKSGSDVVKFDKATYDKARQALAQLIAIEAKEMEEGHDEQTSISHLLEAVHHLFAWYQGEALEGEVEMEETIELAAHKDDAKEKKMTDMKPKKGETYKEFMSRCKELGMEDTDAEKCWKKYGKGIEIEIDGEEEEEEKTAQANKCLECGCHQPENTHGRTQLPDGTNVSTANIVSPSETPKSAEADQPTDEAKVDTDKPEDTSEVSADDKTADLEAIVEEVVEKATTALKSEIASLVSAKEAAEKKSVALESELAHAKSLAVAGGPKRTAKADQSSNDLIAKAATYKAKANATTDPILAKGYRALADKYYAEANTTLNK